MVGLFDFEQDGRYPLRRIPMITRFNLDACGIKISLAAWITLTRSEREQLLVIPCTSESEKIAYCAQLTAMLVSHADSLDAVVEFFETKTAPAWKNELELPPSMIKLSRPGHKNTNLLPAMQEFGLA